MAETTIGITLDCNDIVAVAAFWRSTLDYAEHGPPAADAAFHGLFTPDGRGGLHHLTLQRVGERKAGKNRAHLDLFVDDLDREVERLLGLGGAVVEEHSAEGGGFRTTVMGDPEGNEFCVVQRPDPS